MLVVLAISVTRDLLVTEWRKIYAGQTGGGPAGLFAFRRRSNTVACLHEFSARTRSCNRFDDVGLCHARSYARDITAAGREGTPKGARTCNYGATVNY